MTYVLFKFDGNRRLWSPERDLNPRPAVYETAALPTEPPGHTIPTNENKCVFLRHSDTTL